MLSFCDSIIFTLKLIIPQSELFLLSINVSAYRIVFTIKIIIVSHIVTYHLICCMVPFCIILYIITIYFSIINRNFGKSDKMSNICDSRKEKASPPPYLTTISNGVQFNRFKLYLISAKSVVLSDSIFR